MPRIIHYIFESKIQCVQPLVLPARGTGNNVSDIYQNVLDENDRFFVLPAMVIFVSC